jgi:copper transport protein
MRGRPLPATVLAAVAALLLVAGPVAAHAVLKESEPVSGARLDAMPLSVRVVLTEGIEPSGTTMHVLDASGNAVDDGRLAQTDTDTEPVLTLGLKPGLPDGIYTVSWHVLSKDTHSVSQSIAFAVGGFTAPTGSDVQGGGLNAEAGLARSFAYLGLTLALGAAGFAAWVAPGRVAIPQRLVGRLVLLGAAAHLVGTLVLIHFTAGASQLDLESLYHTSVGQNLFLRAALAAAAVVLALGGAGGKTRAGTAMAGLLLGINLVLTAMASHSFKGGPATVALDALHLASAALWVGGLVLFLLVAWRVVDRSDTATLRALGARFGTLAFATVVALAATGTITGLAIVGPSSVLTTGFATSPYGLFLLGKIAVWAVMVLLAAVNRYVLLAVPAERGLARPLQALGRALSGGRLKPLAQTTKPFQRTLAVEAVLGAVVLVLAGFLTSLSPPALATSTAPPGTTVEASGLDHVAQLRMDPSPKAGGASTLLFTILEKASGRRLANNTCGGSDCVSLVIAAPGGGNATQKRVATPSGGQWLVQNMLWATAGDWTLTMTVYDAVSHNGDKLTFTVTVKAP